MTNSDLRKSIKPLSHLSVHVVNRLLRKIRKIVSVLTALKNTKSKEKFNITSYGEIFYKLTYWDKI